MALWATKRRLMYGGSFVSVVLVVFVVVFWGIIYTPPTCNDGKKNGDEKGVDCGGSCRNLCTADTLKPVTIWAKTFHVSSGVYTAVAYVENPNINSRNPRAKYKFSIFDANNSIIHIEEGETSIPKNKRFAIFETGLVLKSSEPRRTEFEFTGFDSWQKDFDPEPEVSLEYGALVNSTSTPRITGKIKNTSTVTISQVELAVFVLDARENVVAASRSFIDNLLKGSTQDFVFTWPKSFNLGVEVCASPTDVSVLLDRSGSMRSENIDPPEPFNTVKKTASDYIRNLGSEDQASVITFGDNARMESGFTLDKNILVFVVGNLLLSSTTQEQTNVYEGLLEANNELRSRRARLGAKKALIMLTDGIPTEPKNKEIADYPVISAQTQASQIRDSGVTLYTIGLGSNVNEGFLKSISTDERHYFFAPTKETLSGIYEAIGAGLCDRKPNVITVIYRFL